MKFGLNIINFGPNASPAALRDEVLWAERTGFHLAMVSDHVAVTPDVARMYPAPFYEPFTTLAWLAGITSTIELGTTVVILPYRHPLLVARMSAMIDQFSEGRLILGVGVGWAKAEFEALRIPFDRRGQLTDEALQALAICWDQAVGSFEGASIRFRDVHTPPLPIRKPPVWVGGSSTAAIRRTARHGDGWHPLNARLDWLTQSGLPRLRQMAEREHRATPAFAPRIRLRLTESPVQDPNRPPGHGTIDQLRADLDQLQAMGAEWVVFDTYSGNVADLPAAPEGGRQAMEVLLEKAIDVRGYRLRG